MVRTSKAFLGAAASILVLLLAVQLWHFLVLVKMSEMAVPVSLFIMGTLSVGGSVLLLAPILDDRPARFRWAALGWSREGLHAVSEKCIRYAVWTFTPIQLHCFYLSLR